MHFNQASSKHPSTVVNSSALSLVLAFRIHSAASAHADPPSGICPIAREDARQPVLVHQVLLPCPALLVRHLEVLLLVLGEDQVPAPATLATAHVLGQPTISAAVHGLGHAVDVAAVVPLVVALEVDPEVAVLVGSAASARERRLAARRAELLAHVLCDLEAAVAAQHPVLEVGNAGERGGDEVEVHAQRDVFHGVVGGEDGGLERLLRGLGGNCSAGVLGLVLFDVGRGDPAVFVVGVVLEFLGCCRLVGRFAISLHDSLRTLLYTGGVPLCYLRVGCLSSFLVQVQALQAAVEWLLYWSLVVEFAIL
ncbi:hypothetical protein TOPH_03303 [Tolypocladium ophioglossoides CBS 100239]|uniref:Uncharacterized protein n=1 Tax=Tolypocladium ophioglossoides (strain CBS 100239) TaxID=1163406 RepID=A0A0L0NDK6_TOLOC|nr:hypothetical protein TOPH_03303 [Tolypocladium ophioglossoides CBS 100239]